jgi:hypothetical protein
MPRQLWGRGHSHAPAPPPSAAPRWGALTVRGSHPPPAHCPSTPPAGFTNGGSGGAGGDMAPGAPPRRTGGPNQPDVGAHIPSVPGAPLGQPTPHRPPGHALHRAQEGEPRFPLHYRPTPGGKPYPPPPLGGAGAWRAGGRARGRARGVLGVRGPWGPGGLYPSPTSGPPQLSHGAHTPSTPLGTRGPRQPHRGSPGPLGRASGPPPRGAPIPPTGAPWPRACHPLGGPRAEAGGEGVLETGVHPRAHRTDGSVGGGAVGQQRILRGGPAPPLTWISSQPPHPNQGRGPRYEGPRGVRGRAPPRPTAKPYLAQ